MIRSLVLPLALAALLPFVPREASGGEAASANPAAASAAVVPGHVLVEGAWVPDEPYKEGMTRATGLQQLWPKRPSAEKNPLTPEKVELGKLLFYDPIVSGDNKTSCAHCHHPDFGYSDGRKTSMGFGGEGFGPARAGGEVLARSAPTIWNAAYSSHQFWDGRTPDLEAQADGPITAAGEMNQKPEELVGELSAIPEYVALFRKAFGDGEPAVTYDRARQAIASFERTVVSFNSKFDRYAAGDTNAMNEAEKRGMKLFRSLKTRCFECHTFPNFTDGTFRVLGVPREDGTYDPGRASVPGQGPFHAMKTPTLRNVALTAPYMHNGRFDTLEQVMEYYSKGGGHQFTDNPIAGVDDKIGTFEITPEETADLVAFMHALTDTSLQAEAPKSVPSGLPVVEVKSVAIPQPPLMASVAGASGAASSAASASSPGSSSGFASSFASAPRRSFETARASSGGGVGDGATASSVMREASLRRRMAELGGGAGGPVATISVGPGMSIQAAVDRAQPGDRVEVHPGIYHQSIVVDRDGVNLIGLEVDGEIPVLDGQGTIPDAVLGSGRDFTMDGFVVRNYSGNGIVNSKTSNTTYRNLVVENTGLYGIYPVEVDGVLVEGCVVSGAQDAGIYVGQSRNIVVRNNEVFNNVAGIEIENSINALVTNNSAHHNTAGILVFLLPSGASKVASHCRVVNNRSWANNHPNFGKKGTVVSFIPPGMGILVMAADHTEVTGNQLFENDSQGILVSSFLSSGAAPKDKFELDIEPNPDNNLIHGNIYRDNGREPAKIYKALGIGGADVMWDGAGTGNGFRESVEVKTAPAELPKESGFVGRSSWGAAGAE